MSEELELIGEESLVEHTPAETARPAEKAEKTEEAQAGGASSARVRPDPLYHRALLLLASAIVGLSVVLSVRQETQVLLPVVGTPLPELCMMKRMTGGLGCPGCGMTRCFISLGHGDLAAAWSYNPAGLWFYAILAFQVPYRAIQLWRIRRGLPEISMPWVAQVSLGLLAVFMVGQWLLRLCGVEF